MASDALDDNPKKRKTTEFNPSWLNDVEINACITEDSDKSKFYCIICKQSYVATSITHVKNHLSSARHEEKKNLKVSLMEIKISHQVINFG